MMPASVVGSIWAGVTSLASPALRVLLRYRARRGKEIADRLPERRGIDSTPRPTGRLLWLHAASVGESVSILPVIKSLASLSSDLTVLLTTGTITSCRLLEQRLPSMKLDKYVLHRFVPLDVPAWVGRFLDHWQPDAAGFVESELWPNILTSCRKRAIPVMLINARMSARSYARWARAPWAAQVVIGGFAHIHARGEEDAARLRALGASRIELLGDLKLAACPLTVDIAKLREMSKLLAGRPIFLAASTHPGEEALVQIVHDTLRANHPGLLTIIVPRHPERGPELSGALKAPSRQGGQLPPIEGVWIADTLGELGLWYRLSHVAFIGRSLIAPGGGQNPLEPARLSCCIASGPFISNFLDHVTLLQKAGALEVVSDVGALAKFVNDMLSDPEARRQMGARAKAVVGTPSALPRDVAEALLGLMQRE
jgi:3-deoxy-D-manno-octulosonic-acid transferase